MIGIEGWNTQFVLLKEKDSGVVRATAFSSGGITKGVSKPLDAATIDVLIASPKELVGVEYNTSIEDIRDVFYTGFWYDHSMRYFV